MKKAENDTLAAICGDFWGDVRGCPGVGPEVGVGEGVRRAVGMVMRVGPAERNQTDEDDSCELRTIGVIGSVILRAHLPLQPKENATEESGDSMPPLQDSDRPGRHSRGDECAHPRSGECRLLRAASEDRRPRA